MLVVLLSHSLRRRCRLAGRPVAWKGPGQALALGNISTRSLVYLVCVPGMFAAVITAYTLFFSGENLLDANLLVYFLPIASMVATLVLIRKNVSFDEIPGFDHLSGLMVMVGCSFAIALAIQKTRIWVFFGGSIEKLFFLAAGIFALLKWGTYMLFRRRDEPRQELPKFPGA
jgi:hypothetical protein